MLRVQYRSERKVRKPRLGLVLTPHWIEEQSRQVVASISTGTIERVSTPFKNCERGRFVVGGLGLRWKSDDKFLY